MHVFQLKILLGLIYSAAFISCFIYWASMYHPIASMVKMNVSKRGLWFLNDVYLKSDQATYSSKCNGMIPKIIHQVCASCNSSADIPFNYYKYIYKCKSFNNDFRYMLWTRKDIMKFLMDHYSKYEYILKYKGLYMSDASRFFILYHYGGIYFDMDMLCLQRLEFLTQKYTCFIDQERNEQSMMIHGVPLITLNSALGCAPHHPFFQFAIDHLHFSSREADVLDRSGPFFIGRVYRKFARRFRHNLPSLLPHHVFNPALDDSRVDSWRSRCYWRASHRVLPLGGVTSPRLFRTACRLLERRGFNRRPQIYHNDTVAEHAFLHLGYGRRRIRRRFNVTRLLPPVIQYTLMVADDNNVGSDGNATTTTAIML